MNETRTAIEVVRSQGTISEARYRIDVWTFEHSPHGTVLSEITTRAEVYRLEDSTVLREYPVSVSPIYGKDAAECMLEAGIRLGMDYQRHLEHLAFVKDEERRRIAREKRKQAAARKATA